MSIYLDLLISGILLGGLYSIIAIGLSMAFGIMKRINLAHGDLMILASYLSFFYSHVFGLNPLVTLFLVLPVLFVFGYAIQSFLFNRVLAKGMEPFLMVSFGLSIIMQNVLLLIFTPDARTLQNSLVTQVIDIGPSLSVPVIHVINFAAGVLVIGFLHLFLKRTYLGWAIKASADNLPASKLMGIDTKRVYALAMGIAAATAAIAGVLLGMTFTFYPHSGTQYLIIAFGVVIIGGIGSLPGTFLGSLILAIAQMVGAQILGGAYQLLSGYFILLIVLIVRPQGLFAGK